MVSILILKVEVPLSFYSPSLLQSNNTTVQPPSRPIFLEAHSISIGITKLQQPLCCGTRLVLRTHPRLWKYSCQSFQLFSVFLKLVHTTSMSVYQNSTIPPAIGTPHNQSNAYSNELAIIFGILATVLTLVSIVVGYLHRVLESRRHQTSPTDIELGNLVQALTLSRQSSTFDSRSSTQYRSNDWISRTHDGARGTPVSHQLARRDSSLASMWFDCRDRQLGSSYIRADLSLAGEFRECRPSVSRPRHPSINYLCPRIGRLIVVDPLTSPSTLLASSHVEQRRTEPRLQGSEATISTCSDETKQLFRHCSGATAEKSAGKRRKAERHAR